MDITQQIARQTKDLLKQLDQLRNNDLQDLISKKATLESDLAKVNAQIASKCKRLGVAANSPTIAPAEKATRHRMSGEEIRTKINEVLKANPQGISQIKISEQTGVSYASVINFLKDNQDTIRTQGDRKSKLVFLK